MSANLERELITDILAFEHDPLGYVQYVFTWGEGELAEHKGPRKWQVKALTHIGKKLKSGEMQGVHDVIQYAVSSGHGIGKSTLVAWLILWAMGTKVDTRGVVTANTETQLQKKTWPEVHKWHNLAINKHWFELTATAIFSRAPGREKTWRIDIQPWSERNTEAFAGLHNAGKRILLIFDEASSIPDKIWEVAEGALTDENTEIVWAVFGNPTRSTGRFRECWRKFKARWTRQEIDARDVPGTNHELFARWAADYGEDSDFFKVRVRGMFPSSSFKQFISEDDANAGYGKHLGEAEYKWAAKIISVEPAWEGDDDLVIGIRQGLAFSILAVQAKNDNDLVVGHRVAELEDEHNADAVFIDLGWGQGIISYGRTLGRNWVPVAFAEKADDDWCINKRAEMWKRMRDWLKEGGAYPEDEVMRQELCSPEIVARTDGRLQLEAKKDMKARGVPSPNKADCLAITFAHDVRPHKTRSKPGRAITKYNPYGRER